jgi:hypothetical protein
VPNPPVLGSPTAFLPLTHCADPAHSLRKSGPETPLNSPQPSSPGCRPHIWRAPVPSPPSLSPRSPHPLRKPGAGGLALWWRRGILVAPDLKPGRELRACLWEHTSNGRIVALREGSGRTGQRSDAKKWGVLLVASVGSLVWSFFIAAIEVVLPWIGRDLAVMRSKVEAMGERCPPFLTTTRDSVLLRWSMRGWRLLSDRHGKGPCRSP